MPASLREPSAQAPEKAVARVGSAAKDAFYEALWLVALHHLPEVRTLLADDREGERLVEAHLDRVEVRGVELRGACLKAGGTHEAQAVSRDVMRIDT